MTDHHVPSTRTPRVPWQLKFASLVLIWGSSFLLMKVGLEAMHPIQIAALRILSGVLVLLLLLRLSGATLPRGRRVWAHLAVNGFFLATLPFSMFALAETRISSALAGIGNATTPIATVIVALLMLPSERVTWRKAIAVVIGFVGVVTIIQPAASVGPDILGFAMAVVGGCSYGIGWTYNRRFLAQVDLGGLAQPTAVLLAGGILLVPVLVGWWLSDRAATPFPWSLRRTNSSIGEFVAPRIDGTAPAWLAVGCILVLGLVGTGLAYMLQYDVVRAAGPVVGSTMTFFLPIVAVLLGVLILGEHLAWPQLAGFALVLAAAAVVNRAPRELTRAREQIPRV